MKEIALIAKCYNPSTNRTYWVVTDRKGKVIVESATNKYARLIAADLGYTVRSRANRDKAKFQADVDAVMALQASSTSSVTVIVPKR